MPTIPILDLYENAIKDSGAKVVMLCANNYPAKLAGNFGIDNLFQFNSLLVEKGGQKLVELSDDWVEFAHLLNPAEVIKSGRLKQITDKAGEAGLYLLAAGTGAQYSYDHHKKLGMGFFDFKAQGQQHYLDIYKAYADLHEALGLQLFTGHRVTTLNKEFFENQLSLKYMQNFIDDHSIIELKQLDLYGFDLTQKISLSEMMNMALALALNKQNPEMLQLVEQMQYLGMEPCTVDQVVRFNKFLSRNLPKRYYADMADNGHVGVRGTRTSDDPRDYDLFEYAKAYRGPIVFIHHNILFENQKQAGTAKYLERDIEASKGKLQTPNMPFPERVRDINDYVIKIIENPNVKLIVVSPEPKCGPTTNIEELADEVAEATQITKQKIVDTKMFEESTVIPLVYVTKGKREKFDKILRRYAA